MSKDALMGEALSKMLRPKKKKTAKKRTPSTTAPWCDALAGTYTVADFGEFRVTCVRSTDFGPAVIDVTHSQDPENSLAFKRLPENADPTLDELRIHGARFVREWWHKTGLEIDRLFSK